jgi:hypothetical protein
MVELLEVLRSSDNQGVMVEFTKIDGSNRKMLCTLAEALIPEDARPKTKDTEVIAEAETNVAPVACRVYDLEKKGWRSFRLDSVINFTTWD